MLIIIPSTPFLSTLVSLRACSTLSHLWHQLEFLLMWLTWRLVHLFIVAGAWIVNHRVRERPQFRHCEIKINCDRLFGDLFISGPKPQTNFVDGGYLVICARPSNIKMKIFYTYVHYTRKWIHGWHSRMVLSLFHHHHRYRYFASLR